MSLPGMMPYWRSAEEHRELVDGDQYRPSYLPNDLKAAVLMFDSRLAALVAAVVELTDEVRAAAGNG